MNYTKGEWKADLSKDLMISHNYVKFPKGIIASIFYSGYSGEEMNEADANAYLIAAAPEMYEALKAVIGFFESGEFVRDTSRDFEQGWHLKMLPVVKSIVDAQAAISKAHKEAQ